jgi:hypothetical protein
VVGEPALPIEELSRQVSRELRRALAPEPFTDEGGSV